MNGTLLFKWWAIHFAWQCTLLIKSWVQFLHKRVLVESWTQALHERVLKRFSSTSFHISRRRRKKTKKKQKNTTTLHQTLLFQKSTQSQKPSWPLQMFILQHSLLSWGVPETRGGQQSGDNTTLSMRTPLPGAGAQPGFLSNGPPSLGHR